MTKSRSKKKNEKFCDALEYGDALQFKNHALSATIGIVINPGYISDAGLGWREKVQILWCCGKDEGVRGKFRMEQGQFCMSNFIFFSKAR